MTQLQKAEENSSGERISGVVIFYKFNN